MNEKQLKIAIENFVKTYKHRNSEIDNVGIGLRNSQLVIIVFTNNLDILVPSSFQGFPVVKEQVTIARSLEKILPKVTEEDLNNSKYKSTPVKNTVKAFRDYLRRRFYLRVKK